MQTPLKVSRTPELMCDWHSQKWQVNRIYRFVRLSKKQIRIENNQSGLSSYAFKNEAGYIRYEFPERVPKYIKKQIKRMYRLTNKYHE